jgi:hypothetical protein
MRIVQTLSKKLRLFAAFTVIATVGATSTVGAAFAASPSFFDVPKNSPQKVCYKQLGGPGWKGLGFKHLNHCLRYVTTPPPEEKADCNGGWWFVYGFNSNAECKAWVVAHGGGGYDGDMEDDF